MSLIDIAKGIGQYKATKFLMRSPVLALVAGVGALWFQKKRFRNRQHLLGQA